jgi:hypothetical protein
MRGRSIFRSAIVGAALVAATGAAAAPERVACYRSYGFQRDGEWVVPLHVWVREARGFTEAALTLVARSLGGLRARELANLRGRTLAFLSDDESREAVVLADEAGARFPIVDADGRPVRTDANGRAVGYVVLPAAEAATANAWVTLRAISYGHAGECRVQLLAPTGLSVISDIDDTVKVTEIPAGAETIVRNTFVRPFEPAPGMAAAYRELPATAFHYVSGSPWQLYEPLAEFLFGERAGFPEGTFHMKDLRVNVRAVPTGWTDLRGLAGGDATIEQKVRQIGGIFERFPQRRFVLVGDSGEHDPEVYARIQARFPAQVQEIRIRDVVNARELAPERLAGMTVIPAPTVSPPP